MSDDVDDYDFPIENSRPIFGQGDGQYGLQVGCEHVRGKRKNMCSCWFGSDDDEPWNNGEPA